jgi:hypothetical protein
MGQITTALSINNGAASPVAKSFAPERVSPDLSTFTERSAASSAGFIRLSTIFSPASAKRSTNRISLKLDLPVLQTVGGVNSVAYVGRFEGTFIVPDTMTTAERADLAAFVANALDNAQVRGMIKDLDPMY